MKKEKTHESGENYCKSEVWLKLKPIKTDKQKPNRSIISLQILVYAQT